MKKLTRLSALITGAVITVAMLGSLNANALAKLEAAPFSVPEGYEQFDDKGLLDRYNGPYEAYIRENDGGAQFILHYSYKYNYTTFTVVNAEIETYDEIYEKYSEDLGMDYHHRNNVPIAQPDRDVEARMYDMYDDNGNFTKDPTVMDDKFDIIHKMAAEMYEAGCISEATYNVAVCYEQNAYYTGMGIKLNTEDDASEYDNVEAIVSKYEGGKITSFDTMYYIDADFFAANDLYDELHAAYPGSTGGVYTTFIDANYTASTENIDVIVPVYHSYNDIPYYQWTDTPALFGEDIIFVSDEDNPLKGFITREPVVSKVFFRTEMETVNAETLGLPEGTEIIKPNDFYGELNSYVNTRDGYYCVKGYNFGSDVIDTLTANSDVDCVVTETINFFTPQGTLGVYFTTEYEAELTPEDFEGMMVASVENSAYNEETGTQSHHVFLSEEAFANGIDYNVLYNYISTDTELNAAKTEHFFYNYREEYDGKVLYSNIALAPHKYAYTSLKGSIYAAEDVDSDLYITITDATQTLTHYAENAVTDVPEYKSQFDVNADGTADISDATMILTAYADNAAGME